MCDEHTAEDNERFFATRRQFGVGVSAAGLMAVLPSPANAAVIAGRTVTIKTPDGECDAYFVAPVKGKHPAVLVWPDIMGLRPAFEQMGRRLAESGYAVLVVNQFYRGTRAPFLQPGEDWQQPDTLAKIKGWRAALTPAATARDASAFIGWLDQQPQVNAKRGVATTGYCMGGPMTMITAATIPGRVRAGASFHGGGIATDKPDSPHLLVPRMKAQFLFAVAANDDQRNPQEKETVRAAFAAAKLPAEIEVYEGAMHGWCPPDSKVYNQAQAERAWARQLALFGRALG